MPLPAQGEKKQNDEKDERELFGMARGIGEEVMSEVALGFPELSYAGIRNRENTATDDNVWHEEPISIERFVNDPYHMGQPKLSMRQAKALNEFLGKNEKRIFVNPETPYRLATLLWGKGSGKDWICTLLQCYIVYQLLCMKDPRKILSLAPDESIDILNIAYSADQASRVYFTKFLNRIHNWPWLSEHFPIIDKNKMVNRGKHGKCVLVRGQYVKISEGMVEFPHFIRAISEHSESESYEGYNVFFFVMDEAAAFRDKGKKANANRVYSTLRTSAHSRFPSLWRGILISYPRAEGDFMMVMYNLAVKDMASPGCTMYADIGCTWEINPTKRRDQFDNERVLDERDYDCKYRCKPPPAEGAIFDPNTIDMLLTDKRFPLFRAVTSVIPVTIVDPAGGRSITRKRIGKVVSDFRVGNIDDKKLPRVFHVDAGLTICPAALIVAHGEPCIVQLPNIGGATESHVVNRVVVDQCVVWMPDKGRGISVSINNIASVIQELSHHFNIVRGSYDQWNSESSIEALMGMGIPVEKHNISDEDYGRMEMLINLSAIDIPMHDWVEWEILTQAGLKKIIQSGGAATRKYMVADGGYKDPVDCLAGVCRLLNAPEIRALTSGVAAPRILSGVSLMSAESGANPGARSSMQNSMLPGKLINNAPLPSEFTMEQGIRDSRSQAIIQHHLIDRMGGELSYKAPANLGRKKAPKIITSR